MGLAAAPTGVTFRTGPFTPSGEHVVHGLVIRFGASNYVNDNAACFADAAFPTDGSIIPFGDHRVYVAVISDEYPREVLTFTDPSLAGGCGISRDVADLCTLVEVLATSSGTSSHRNNPLHVAVRNLRAPITLGTDPTTAAAKLEETCKHQLNEATELAAMQRRMESMQHVYNTAHGFTHAGDRPSHLEEVQY
jgi:hypothetical protein